MSKTTTNWNLTEIPENLLKLKNYLLHSVDNDPQIHAIDFVRAGKTAQIKIKASYLNNVFFKELESNFPLTVWHITHDYEKANNSFSVRIWFLDIF